MTTTNTSCEVSIRPTKNFFNKIRKSAGLGSCRNLFNDDVIYTTLKDCNMDQTETCRTLTMIHDVKVAVDIKNSVDEVYSMLKECNMDQSEATQRLLYFGLGFRVLLSLHLLKDILFKRLKRKKIVLQVVMVVNVNGDTVQEDEKKKDKQKSVSNGDTVQEVEQKKDTQQKSVGKWDNQRGASRSSKVYNDAGRRSLTSGKEYGVTNNHVKKVWRPVDSRKESNGAHMASSAAYVSAKLPISNGSQSHKLVPKLSSVTVSKNTTASAINTHSASNVLKLASPRLDVMQKRLPVSSCQSVIFPDHLHVPENCKSEFVFGSLAATRPPKPSLSCTAKSGQATSAAYVSAKLPISNGSQSHKLVPKLSSVTVSKNTTASAINTHSASNVLKLASPRLDVMQKRLPVSSCQSVIFPDHLHVPENCKSEFVFGSLAATRPPKPSLSCTAKSGQAT
ncbi:UBA-like, GBF-interacting protein 1 [Artemisia annua]|uniref:UBA-like, GBF-interacting protein 1 n=1 Tax=Artemisia annua TaxID=35608 RepID=A0A2U1PWK0_ARTAN|nr:UBA-like, GBF-interacting protein 1 [Artemisia annua]